MTEPAEIPQLRPPEEHAEGTLDLPDGVQVLEGSPIGGRRGVAVLVAKFNGEITTRLLASALEELERAGVSRESVTVVPVPGAFELPLAALALAKTRRFSCLVALGCVIRGETSHFDFVAGESASGLQLAAIETGIPVAFGVLRPTQSDRPGRWTRGRPCGRRSDSRPLRPAPLLPAAAPRNNPSQALRYTAAAMPKICAVCGRSPRSGTAGASMVATKRRFDPNSRVRVNLGAAGPARHVCTRCPEGQQGPGLSGASGNSQAPGSGLIPAWRRLTPSPHRSGGSRSRRKYWRESRAKQRSSRTGSSACPPEGASGGCCRATGSGRESSSAETATA